MASGIRAAANVERSSRTRSAIPEVGRPVVHSGEEVEVEIDEVHPTCELRPLPVQSGDSPVTGMLRVGEGTPGEPGRARIGGWHTSPPPCPGTREKTPSW